MFFSFSTAFIEIPGYFENFTKSINYALPIIFYYDHHDLSVRKSITKRIKEFYFDSKLTREKEFNFTNVWLWNVLSFAFKFNRYKNKVHFYLIQMFGDGWFLAAMDSYLHSKRADTKYVATYVYLLTNKASTSFSTVAGGDPNKYYGSCFKQAFWIYFEFF